jgi:hypothetical protein
MKNMKRVWLARVDGVMEKFTRQDVEDYLNKNHGFGGCRSFGSVSGDWRMIESLVDGAISHFGM